VAGGLAGDQHPGHRPVTSQPPAGLRVQRAHPPRLPTKAAGAVLEAVQVDGDQQLRADPTRLGQLATLKGPAAQLGQGVSVALVGVAGVIGMSGAGQRFQGRLDEVAGFGLQQPLDRHHVIQGWGQPQAPSVIAAPAGGLSPRRVGNVHQIPDGLAQQGRIQPASRLDQHRVGLQPHVVRQVPGARGHHLRVGW
jgi:hypothetical protein